MLFEVTLRNLYKRNVNQLVSIFSATDSVLTQRDRKTHTAFEKSVTQIQSVRTKDKKSMFTLIGP